MTTIDPPTREYTASCTTCGAWTVARHTVAVAWTRQHRDVCAEASTEVQEVAHEDALRAVRLLVLADPSSRSLDRAADLIDLVRRDLNTVMRELPEHSSLWAHVDLVRALCHLHQAAVLIDKAADQLDETR
jgi:hypothetical protein